MLSSTPREINLQDCHSQFWLLDHYVSPQQPRIAVTARKKISRSQLIGMVRNNAVPHSSARIIARNKALTLLHHYVSRPPVKTKDNFHCKEWWFSHHHQDKYFASACEECIGSSSPPAGYNVSEVVILMQYEQYKWETPEVTHFMIETQTYKQVIEWLFAKHVAI